ncbi:MAG: CpaF/VirB11 family protein [Actinomycetota bacterium]|nr:CpaF/VirB11 family protein [Actinomycetota bacterium]
MITIEDTLELKLNIPHVVRLESKPPNIEGRGAVTIRQLVKNSLRMRPDRIIVGEIRGPEAIDVLQAMNTGHNGSLSTLHANSSVDMLSRLETLLLINNLNLTPSSVKRIIASSLDLVVHLEKGRKEESSYHKQNFLFPGTGQFEYRGCIQL